MRFKSDISENDVTPQPVFESRRDFIRQSVGVVALGGLGLSSMNSHAEGLTSTPNPSFRLDETPTPLEKVTTYNNFYEFSTDKEEPHLRAGSLKTRPWSIRVEGEVNKPKTFAIEDILKMAPLEERIYRFRCVETWSMVVPWVGFPLSVLLKAVEPTGNAKFVEFVTLSDPEQMPGVKRAVLDWPYREGLRIDEAMNPLTLVTVGLYGQLLPNQNGAPVRIIVPWKYGFKSAKSIVSIRLTETMPTTSWMKAGPSEYGFYANVNPEVDHPRWSQARERRLGEFLKRPTLPFNGYGDQVASLYQGMDLARNF
jgi:methionine sulfoxide reductase catalytic subunit